MNFLNLEYFVMVAKEKEMRKAAQKLFITEQALGKQIRKLEKEIGADLFVRTRPLRLTEAGEIVYRDARQMLKLRDRMMRKVSETTKKKQIRVGIMEVGIPEVLTNLVVVFQLSHPHCEVELVPIHNDGTHDEADIYLSPEYFFSDCEHEVLMEDCVCVAVSDALIERTYGETADYMRREFERGDINSFSELPFGNGASVFWDSFGERLGFTPTIASGIVNGDVVKKMCLGGLCASLVPLNVTRIYGWEKEVNIYPIVTPGSSFSYSINYDKTPDSDCRDFIDGILKFFRK
ncbi:MAG: LysR family transcriptional regulator [Eubacterium sp.]|nr:LysR family transcriptional regulator [Eubacterium sp.]